MIKSEPERKLSTPSVESDNAQDYAGSVIEYIVVPTFVLDSQGRVVIWNRACERLTGVAASEIIGTSDHWRAFYEEPRPTLADFILKGRTDALNTLYARHDVVHTDHNNTVGEHDVLSAANWCHIPRTGMRLYLTIDAGPIYDRSGRLIGAIETWRDMTAHKEAQLALEQLASRDGLTALANRRYFDDFLQREWLRTRRESQPLSLLMLDVDYFKSYNDTYGHPAGDECLRRVADTVVKQMRTYDLIARYGGEEFAIILPNQSLEAAAIVAERIRSTVEQLGLPHAASDTGHVTVSVGVATEIGSSTSDWNQLTSAADTALYHAKKAGRNRISLIR